jgi:hypothetical protein
MKALGGIFLIPCLTLTSPIKGQEEAGAYSLVISEIMADPHPAVALPDAEYLEIYNRGSSPVPLAGYRLLFGDKIRVLLTPSHRGYPNGVSIEPGEYVILCDVKDTALFVSRGKTLSVKDMPALVNTGATLTLESPSGKIIHSVSFSDSWYRSADRANGGWALEMIDPDNPCGHSGNWCESNDPTGGTPGYINSVNAENPDIKKPELLRASLDPDSSVMLYFSEDMDSASLADPLNYYCNRGLFHPAKADPVEPAYSRVNLVFKGTLNNSLSYSVTVLNSLTDCVGNPLKNNAEADFAIPQPADSFDLVINELLFDASPGMSEFIELFNRSEKVVDLAGFSLASCNVNTDTIVRRIFLKETSFLLFPGQYVVITRRADQLPGVNNRPDLSVVIELPSLFALADKEGQIALLNTKNQVIDRFYYNPFMHSAFIKSEEGISLERIDPDRPTNEPDNWFSAASDKGYSTPGYQNSQSVARAVEDEQVSISPAVFSPDGDGSDDMTYVTLLPGGPGYICNAAIFDVEGRKMRILCSAMLLGTETIMTWDGICNDNREAPPGIYLIYIEMYNQKGIVKKYRKVVTLARKLVMIN